MPPEAPSPAKPATWVAPAIIGAGYGRTGTTSLMRALEVLGFGPCYHMAELQRRPDDIGPWLDACSGKPVDWDNLLRGYGATLDWPACEFWPELSDLYPTAKVILTLRDPDAWYQSVMATGYPLLKRLHDAAEADNKPAPLGNLLIMKGRLLDVFPDRDRAVAAFEEHNASVIDALPANRLLVFDAAQGWDSLCQFLEVKIPEVPFPRANSRRAYWETDDTDDA